MSRKNIKLKEDLFERLKADKPDTMSWPRYFEEQCLSDAETTDDSDVGERLERIEALTREAAEAAQSAKRGVEELGGGR